MTMMLGPGKTEAETGDHEAVPAAVADEKAEKAPRRAQPQARPPGSADPAGIAPEQI
jgi:hypothetical protein